jgi:hypothetical protein
VHPAKISFVNSELKTSHWSLGIGGNGNSSTT